MIKKFLLLTLLINIENIKPNTTLEPINTDEITIEKIRKEVNSLDKSILGQSKITLESSPYLYKLVENLVNKINLEMPELIVAKGLFTPLTANETKLSIFQEQIPIQKIIAIIAMHFMAPYIKKLNNANAEIVLEVLIAYSLIYILENSLLGLQKTNAFGMKNINGKSKVAVGINLINNLNVDELKSIIAHELGHIKYNHILKINIFNLPFLYFINRYYKKEEFNKSRIISLLLIIISRFIMRLLEKEADITSVKITNKPNSMISALTKLDFFIQQMILFLLNRELVKPIEKSDLQVKITNSINAIAGSHPTLEQRIEYLKQIKN